MKKILLLSISVLKLTVAEAQTTNPYPYCKPVFQNTAPDNLISSLDLGNGTVNVSGSTNLGYMFYDNIAPLQIKVIKGSKTLLFLMPIVLDRSTGSDKATTLRCYIDFNHDNVFDASEMRSDAPTLGMGANWINLPLISDSSYAGVTRMRVMWTNDPAADPCNGNSSFAYNGETEDYLVNITNTLPIARATGASDITGNTATLNGTVYVNGLNAAATAFEYGQTTAYTNAILGSTLPADTSGNINALTANISGLSPYTIYHYRVKAFNGTDTMYSKDQMFVTGGPTGIVNTISNSSVIISRPAANALAVRGLSADQRYKLALTDVNGKVVTNTTITNDETITVPELSSGIYFLRITGTANNIVFRDKLLLQ